jgi:hypothetical protein
LIVRQNALTNSCNLVAAGKANYSDIEAMVNQFTDLVFETSTALIPAPAPSPAPKAAANKAASKPPVGKKKVEPVVEEEEDDTDPYDIEE